MSCQLLGFPCCGAQAGWVAGVWGEVVGADPIYVS